MRKELDIKVCGITQSEQAKALSEMGVDYIGNIYYPSSPRNAKTLVFVPGETSKVGVFVNATKEEIQDKIISDELHVIQLHGDESADFIDTVKGLGVRIWKVFKVDEDFDFGQMNQFENADAFLLDTKTKHHGGSGKKFDWNLLHKIETKKPFWLSGGIDLEDAKAIVSLDIENLVGVDINSRFETSPGIKDLEKVKKFIEVLRK
jgi:phosphoribosylanthranilate isomerase